MPKKKSLKSQKDGCEKSVVEEPKKASPSVKKPKDEIDEIFASKKRKRQEQEKAEKKDAENKDLKSKKKKKKDRGLEIEKEANEPSSRPRRRTGDGFAIYSEEELGLNKADAGGTPLCPFDCSCCF